MAPNIRPGIRGRIIGHWECGRSIEQIADDIGVSQKTVRRWIRRYVTGGNEALEDHRHLNQRPCDSLQEEDYLLVEYIRDRPFGNVPDAMLKTGFPLSERTGRRRLNAAGIHCCRLAKKILLTSKHREERVGFALENLVKSREELETTVWTDEKIFISSVDRCSHVWRPAGFRLDPDYVVQTNRSGRITCGMWGWMCGNAMSELVEIPPSMASGDYLSILEEVLLPSIRAIYPVEDMPIIRLVQDNSAVHTSRETRAWFEDHPEIQVVNWPALSPDLNLIENVRARVTRDWVPPMARTTASLLDAGRTAWEGLQHDRQFLANLINSIPNRLEQVIQRSGYWTDY